MKLVKSGIVVLLLVFAQISFASTFINLDKEKNNSSILVDDAVGDTKTGVVKLYNSSKGFGYITDDESGTDYFVHESGLKESIKAGDKVEFELATGRKGYYCINVKKK